MYNLYYMHYKYAISVLEAAWLVYIILYMGNYTCIHDGT